MSDDRITELEKIITFQDQKMKDFSEAILSQDKKIDQLEKALQQLRGQVNDETLVRPIEQEDEKPPHY